MRSRNLALGTFVLAAAALVAGCGQTPPGPAQSSNDDRGSTQPANEYDVKPASATAKIGELDSQIQPALTTADAQSIVADPAQSAPSPVGPDTPMPLDELPDAELAMPKVFLTEAHAKTCLLGVGDPFPNFELPDLAGDKQVLGELLGERLTVIVFWSGKQATALTELADLQPRVAARFGEAGVALVGINTGDDPQLAAELAGQAGAEFVNLSDRDGAALAQVATGKLPRTYLLDPAGKILWFDLEYSRTTRRDLSAAIRFSLSAE